MNNLKKQSSQLKKIAYTYLVSPETKFQRIFKWTVYIIVGVIGIVGFVYLYPIFVNKFMVPGVEYLQWKFEKRPMLLLLIIFVVNSLLPLIFLKGEIFEILAAMMYSFWVAFLVCQLSQMIGATLVFFLGRYALKERVERKVMANKKLKAIFEGINIVGPFKVCIVVRLSAIPFAIVNYLFSVCEQVKFGVYFITTSIMIIPWNVIQILIGQNYKNFAVILSGKERRPEQYVIGFVVILVTVVLFVGGYLVSKRALDRIEKQAQQRRDQEALEQQPLFESSIEMSDARSRDYAQPSRYSKAYARVQPNGNSDAEHSDSDSEDGPKLRIEAHKS